MAAKDCIKKLRKAGHKVDLADRRAIKKYKDAGMTDEQAVRRLFVDASVDVVNVAERVEEAGGDVETGAGQVAEIRGIRTERLRNLMGQRTDILNAIDKADADYKLLEQDRDMFDEFISREVGEQILFSELSDNEIKMVIAQLLLGSERTMENVETMPGVSEPVTFARLMREGILTVEGTTTAEIYASRVALDTALSDNRKQKQLLQQQHLEMQELIDSGMGPETTRELFQGPTDEDFVEFEGASVETDQGRIAAMLGPHLYGDQDKMGMVTVKELFQNSFDAVRTALENGEIEDGTIDIKVSDDKRTVTIKDNGVGMTSEMIRTGLLTIGGTSKEGSVNSGGFGIAKMLFLFGAAEIHVETIRDGVKSTLHSTGPDILANAKDGTLPLDTLRDADKAIQREKTEEPSGTSVTVTIPEDYTDQNSGNVVPIEQIWPHKINDMMNGQLLHPKISVTRDSIDMATGANFDADKYDSIGKIQFAWGSADILVTKDNTQTYGTNIKVLNNGLIQFDDTVTEDPFKPLAASLPHDFIIDLHPNEEPGAASYPFELNRQSLREHASKDIARLKMYFTARYREDRMATAAEGYGTLVSLDADNKASGQINIKPVVPQDNTEGLTAGIDPNATIEVVDGKLLVDGAEQTELTAEDIARLSFDVSKYKVDQSNVPANQTLVHSQMSFKDGTQIFTTDPDTGLGTQVDVGGMDVNEALYKLYGEDRVNKYFGDIGNVLIRMKNVVAKIGDSRFAGMEKIGAGVSILGSQFYGVHTIVPARMVFINPGADPHDLDAGQGKRPDLTETVRMQLIASSMLTSMIHELAHFAEMNHEGQFIFALEGIMALLDNTPTLMTEFRNAMRTTLRENYDIYQFLEGQFKADSLEVTGLSLKDVGTQQAGNDVGPADLTGERTADTEGAAAAETGRPSDRDIGVELDDDSLSAGIRPDGIVVPPGSVHPQAGEGAQILEAIDPEERQARLEIFMQDSHVVDENGDPLVVYHGTQTKEQFEVFDPPSGDSFGGWNNLGTWFSSVPEHAAAFTGLPDGSMGRMIPAHLSIKNPLNTSFDGLIMLIDGLMKKQGLDMLDAEAGPAIKAHLQSHGYDGIIIKDFTGDGLPAQDVFVAFESNQIKSPLGNRGTFDPDNPNILKQDERGRITFNDARKGFIEILSSGDSSTFIHETGHMYLEVMRWAAQQPSAPDSLKADWETIKKYTGAEDGSISKEAHEKFANSFEIYTLEGKAPSLALQDSFNAFRSWLLNIYAKIKNIGGVHLNDEIRGVFDRMLASDQEIAIAEQSQGFVALFVDAETAGMTQEQFDHYAKQLTRVHDEAVEKETRRMLLAMTRDQKAWWKEEREKVKEEVALEAYEMPLYKALAMLQKGKQPDGSETRQAPFKIDKRSLMNLLGDDQQTLNDLPRPFIYTLKGGVDVELVAKRFGWNNALDMIRDIGNKPSMDEFIDAETEVRMRHRYPDPLTDGTLAEEAVRAVHSEGRLKILATELRRLRKLEREDRPAIRAKEKGDKREDKQAREANKAQIPRRAELAMLKAGARAKVDSLPIRKIKPHVYLRAEQKAGREAFEAMEKRDYAKAYAAKLRQIVNHEMYRAAVAIQKEMNSTRNFIARFEGPRKQRQLGRAGVLNQILAVLEGIDLRKRSLAEVDRNTALKELKQAVFDGRMVVTPETMRKIMDESVNWQDFTPQELRGMKDVLKQIEHGAVNEDKMTVNDELVDYQEIEDELAMSIVENHEVIPLRPGGVKTSGERANNNVDQGIMTWLRPSSIARVLDKAGFGAVTRRIIVPMRRAYAEKLIPMLHQAQRDVAGFYNKHYTAAELGKMSKRMFRVESLGIDYSKSELLSMALNWGNQGNRDAVLGGTYEGKTVFSEQAVKQMLAHLTVKDWAFVQDIWDYNDTYRDAIFDAEQRRRGIRPEKVEALPFEQRTADGEVILVRGGYHPLRYDTAFDPESGKKPSADRAAENIEKQMQHLAVGGFVTANTRSGSTYNRVHNHGRVVRLGLNIIDSHLREVIRDIAIGDEVAHIKRLLESGGVKRAMIDTNNQAALEALDLWLTDAAVGELPSENIWEFGAAWIRTGFTKAKLGWNFTVMFLQFTGLFQTIAVIGTVPFGKGLAKFIANPAAAMKHVQATSKFIHTRYEVGAFDKDVQDTKALVETEFGNMPTRFKNAYHLIGSTLFAGIAMAQKYVDVITWLGAYEKGLNEPSLLLSEADAVIYADTQVEAAQTSGFFSDRSGLERGTTGLKKNRQSQFIRIWTTLISYMLAKSNIAYEKHKGTDYHSPKEVMALLFDLIMLYTVEGIASAWLYNRMPEDDDEPEDWALWALTQSADSMYTGIPFVREVSSAKFGGGNTPIGVFSNDAYRMIDQLGQGELDWAAIDAVADVLGTAAHLPTGQMSKTGKKIWEDGITTDEWMEYFTGPRD